MTTESHFYKAIVITVIIGMLTSLFPSRAHVYALTTSDSANNGVDVPSATQSGGDLLSGVEGSGIDLVQRYRNALPPELATELTDSGTTLLSGEPVGMLLNPYALQSWVTPPQQPAALDAPLSVSRVQSTYAATTAISNTLIVTFTVTNNQPPVNVPQLDPEATITETIAVVSAFDFSNDPNVIHNVLLTDELLPPQAIFASAAPYPDRRGEVYAWNLGDIPPLGSITMTLKLTVPPSVLDFTELDTGAATWGTLQGRMVSVNTAPITLAPDGLDGWLNCTIDANCNDEYVIEKAAELGNDPNTIFEYVKSLGFESYEGSLRGARGTIWSEAGNSMDQTSLLIALLRASGIPAAYRHGDLDLLLQQQLILSMFPEPQGVIGHIPEGTELSDPANDSQLLEETRDHWWAQAYLPGLGWTQLDPSFANAQVGDTFVPLPSPDPLAEVPDALRHKVKATVKVESYHPLNVGNSGLVYDYPLVNTFNMVELVGEPAILGHVVNTDSQGGAVFYWVRHTYLPYFKVGKTTLIEGQPFEDFTSNFPLGTFLVTGEWLLLEVFEPNGHVSTFEREVFDKVGFEARQQGGALAINASSTAPAISSLDQFAIVAASSVIPETILAENYAQLQSNLPQLTEIESELQNFADLSPAQQQIFVQDITPEINNANFSMLRTMGEGFFMGSSAFSKVADPYYMTKSYFDKPQLAIASYQLADLEADPTVQTSLDLIGIEARVLSTPGQAHLATISAKMHWGIWNTIFESKVLESISGELSTSVSNIFTEADRQGIESIAFTQDNLEGLDLLDISAEAKARITSSIFAGKVIVVPSQMVQINGLETIGWLEIGSDGSLIGVGENGLHQTFLETTGLESLVGVEASIGAQIAGGALFGVYAWIASWADAPFYKSISNGALGVALWMISEVLDELDLGNVGQAISDALFGIVEFTIIHAVLVGALLKWAESAPAMGILASVTALFTIIALYSAMATWSLFDTITDTADDAKSSSGILNSVTVAEESSLRRKNQISRLKNSVRLMLQVGGSNTITKTASLPQVYFDTSFTSSDSLLTNKSVIYTGTVAFTDTLLSADVQTMHTAISGTISLDWLSESDVDKAIQYTNLAVASATVRLTTGELVGSGNIIASSTTGPALLILSSVPPTAYQLVGIGQTSTYGPALDTIGTAVSWLNYAVRIEPNLTISGIISAENLTIDGIDYPAGDYAIEFSVPLTVSGESLGIMPSFTSQWIAQVAAGSVSIAPDTGTVNLGSHNVNTQQSFAVTGFNGSITTTQQTTAIDRVQVLGTVDQLIELDIAPGNSTIVPLQSSQFQINVLSNLPDTYVLEASGPNGWKWQLDETGHVSIEPNARIAQPGDYTFLVTARSRSNPELVVYGKHIVTIVPHQGMVLDVTEDTRITVPWGPTASSTLPDSINDGRLQLPDAAYTINLTNTSTVSHTFALDVSGLPAGWLLLSGAEGQTNTTLPLPAGGVGQVGLYISPTVTMLPPAGTQYPFTVTAVDTDGAGLSANDSDTFTVPAIAFNRVVMDPTLIYAAPATTATLDIALTNVGNIAGSFPLTLTLPLTTWVPISNLQSPVSVNPSEFVTQSVTFNVPTDALLGQAYLLYVDSPAPGTAYVQTAYANVQIVSANALPIYQAAQEITDLFPAAQDVVAALNFLALSIDDLEQSCQQGACDLTLRDRVSSGTDALAQAVEPLSPLLTTDESLAQIAEVIITHTSETDLLADDDTVRDLIDQLLIELRAVAQHDLSAAFTPGLQTTLDNRAALYDLVVTNEGSEPTTAVLTLTPPAGAAVNWSSQSTLLQPGETITVSTVVTPTILGTYVLNARVRADEASLIQHDVVAGLGVVDALLHVSRVDILPAYVEYNSGTTANVQATIANVANVPLAGEAVVQVFDVAGAEVYTTTPTPITFDSALVPLGYTVGSIDTTGLVTGTYTVTVRVVDGVGDLIPKAIGQGRLAVAQAVEATAYVQPAVVTPGDATVTTIIDTELSDAVLNLIMQVAETVKRVVHAKYRTESLSTTESSLETAVYPVPALIQTPLASLPAQQIYSNDFESSAGGEWSNTTIAVTPSGRHFLGQFASNTINLTLTTLPTHTHAVVEFDLFTILTWDGNNSPGPDIWDLSVSGGPTLLHTTFGGTQAYPDAYPGGSYPSKTGAVEVNTLGYTTSGTPLDAVYHLRYTFPHTDTILALNFTGSGLQGVSDESWGLDNVTVSILPAGTDATSVLAFTSFITETTAGDAFVAAVTAEDALGNTTSNYTGTVAFSSSDPQATLPLTYTFTTDDYGHHVFPQIVLATAGTQSVTVTDVSNPALQETLLFDVHAGPIDAGTSQMQVSTPHRADGVETAMLVVTVTDNVGNRIPGADVWVIVGGTDNVVFNSPGTADANGVYTATVTSTKPEAKPVTVLAGDGQVMQWLSSSSIVEFTGAVITGTVFSDTNQDGNYQTSESGLGGVLIRLYAAGSADLLKTTVTQSDGRFTFTNLLSGTYRLEQTQLDEFAFSDSGVLTATVGAFAVSGGHNFGNYAVAQVAGRVWNDGNQNGQHQSGELPLADVTINVYDGASQLVDSTTTAADGTYHLNLTADLPAAPDNFVFNSGRLILDEPATAVIGNADFARDLTPLDPGTYPANYNFSSGDLGGWTPSNAAYIDVIDDGYSLDGPYLSINTYNQYAESPAFTLPASAQSLRFRFHNQTWRNSTTARPLYVYVLSGSGFSTVTSIGSASASNLDGWREAVLDIQAFQGQTIKLRFLTDTDSYWQGQARVDNISLNVEVPDWTFSNALYTAVFSGVNSFDGGYLQIGQYNHAATSSAFVVPANAQSLRFDYQNWTWRNSTTARPLYVYALSGADFGTSTNLGSVSGSQIDGWLVAKLDVQSFQGQTIKLRFLTDTDSYWQGYTRVDNIALYVETPGWTPGDTRVVSIGEDVILADIEIDGPENGDFTTSPSPLDVNSYPDNDDFAAGRTFFPVSTYPDNYDFSSGDLGTWTVSNASYVAVISDVYSLDADYLRINSYSQSADSPAFTLPADAQSLHFDYYNWSWRNSTTVRPLHAYILSGPNYGTATSIGSVSSSDLDGWQTAVLDVQAFRGQTIKLRFQADTDSYWQGRSRIDNLSLAVETPDWESSNSIYVQVANNGYSYPDSGNYLLLNSYNQWVDSPTFSVPADAQALRFNYYNWTWRNSTTARPLYVYVYSGPNLDISTSLGSVSGSNRQGWLTATLDIQAYQGQTIKLRLQSDTDSYWQGQSRIDNISLNLQVPGWQPSSTNVVSIQSSTPPVNPPTNFINGDFHNGRTPLATTTYPDNYDFSHTRIQLDPATYPDNYDFNTGDLGSWTVSNAAYVDVISDTYNLDGPYLGLNSYNQTADSPLFTVPVSAQSVRFNYYNWTWRSTTTARPLYVYALSGPDLGIITSLGSVSGTDDNGWLEGVLDLQRFQGQAIQLRFQTDTDSYWQGRSRVDNISLHTDLPDAWQPSTVSSNYVRIISDTYSLNGPYLHLNMYNQSVDSPVFTVADNGQSLRFNYNTSTWRSSTTARPLYVYVLSGPDFGTVTSLGSVSGSDNEGWKTAQLDIQSFQGEAVKLRFQTDTDSYWQGQTRIDNISLNVEVPGWHLSNANVSSVQATDGISGTYLFLNSYNIAAYPDPFLVPTDTDSLRFDYFNSTWRSTSTSRPLHVYAYMGDDFSIPVDLGTVSGSQDGGWKSATLSLANVRGRLIRLYFLTDTDSYWGGVSRIDNIALVPGTGGPALGSDDNASGDYVFFGQYNAYIDSVTFRVPTNTLSVTFDYSNWTWRNGATSRPVYVYALSGANFGFSTLLGSASGSALSGWGSASLDLSGFRGQIVKLRFQVDTDSYWGGTSKIDNIALTFDTSSGSMPLDDHDSSYIYISSYNNRIDSAPFTVPVGAQSVRFDHLTWTWRNTATARPLYVYALTGSDFSTVNSLGSVTGSALQSWHEGSLNLSAYQGQTIKLRFLTDTDSYWQGRSKIDNVYLLPLTTVPYTVTEINPVNYTSSTPDDIAIDAYGGAAFTINFGDFAVDRYQSSVTVSPTEVTADGSSTAVITVTIRDGSGNPLPGYAVEILAPGSNVTVNQPVTVTNAAGDAVGSISATRAPQTVLVTARTVSDNVTLAQSVPVTFVPGTADADHSTLTATPAAVVANGVDTAAFTVTLRDQFDNPVSGHLVNISVSGTAVTLTQNLIQTDSLGQVSGSIRSSNAQTVTLTAYDATDDITVTQTAVVLFTTADPQQSTVVAVPTTLIADGVTPVTITVTLHDQNNDPLPGKPIHLTVSGSDNYLNGQLITGTTFIGLSDGDGIVTAVLTSTTTGLRTISALGDGVPLAQSAQVSFVVGPVDAAASRLETDTATIIANGNSYATIIAVLYDSYGHPVSGKDVLIQATGTNITLVQPVSQTDAMGSVQATIKSTDVQTVTVQAIDQTDNVTLTQTVGLFFVPGPADPGQSTLTISPTNVIADGVQMTTITTTLRDALGHPTAHRAVQLVVSGSNNVITPTTQGDTDANGTIVFYLASSTVETKNISVRDLMYDVLISGGQVAFVPGVVDLDASELVADKTTVAANGTDAATLTATLYDAYGHPISGKVVTILASGTVTLTQALTTTNSQGRVQAIIQSTDIQTATVTAVVPTDGITLPQTIALDFVAGPPDAINSVITVTPTTAAADNIQSITITADMRDAFGRPLANRAVQLQVSGSNNTVQPTNPATTDANGHVAFTLRSTRAQVKDLSLLDLTSNTSLSVGQVTFVPGAVDADTSIVTAVPTDVPADGVTQATVTIRLLDAYNNAVPGVTAVLTSNAPGVLFTQPAAPSDANGNLTGYVAAVVPGQAVLMVTANGIQLNDTAVVHFSGPDLAVTMTGPSVGVVGREVTYTVSIANQGQLTAAAVTLTDALPAQMTYVRDTSSFPLTQNGNDLTWAIGDLSVSASAQFQVVGLVNSAAPLDGQLINTIQAGSASPEENLSNNSASATLTVGPGYAYQASVVPTAQTAPVGASVTYEVVVRNAGNLADTYQVALNNLNSAWYTLEPSVLTLAPGEVGQATLTIHTDNCTDAGAYQFFALVTSQGAGNTQTVPSDLTWVTTPMITNLLPTNGTAVGATSALFTWQTAVSGTTSLYLRPSGTVTYTEYADASGALHQVTVNGLSRNTSYEWYASTTSACGTETSLPRTLQVLNGIVFTPRQYNFTVERDYNQIVAVTVQNQDTISHTVVVSIENPYPELIVGFIDDGSVDAPITLQPGTSRTVNLGVHTQDVVQRDFNLVARLAATDTDGTLIEDAVPLNIHVNIPDVNFILEETDFDAQTLVRTFRLTNLGDPLTDFAISAVVTGTGSLYLQPAMSHGYLGHNKSFTFEAIPAVDSSFQALTGTVQATAAGVMTYTNASISLPSGTSMYLGEAQDVSMEAKTADWYCTNRPIINNRIVLPPGFRRDDVVSANFYFNINSTWTSVRPHDVNIFLNENEIGELVNLIPHGLYTFPVDPSFLNESLYTPSVNYVKLVTTHFNGGHYVVATDMMISICLSGYREWVAAGSQTEADSIVNSRSFLIPAPTTLDIDVLEPNAGQTVYTGVPVTIKARILDDVAQPLFFNVTATADNGNGGLILYDDGAHGDGGYRDGVYANTWTPLQTGPTTFTFHAGSCTISAETQLALNVAAADFHLDVRHHVPITGTAVLSGTALPVPQETIVSATETVIDWNYTLNATQSSQQLRVDVQLPNMQPGEIREIGSGTVISYTGPGGSGAVVLSPLYVAASHLVAVSPAMQTVNAGSTATYQVTLYNPGPDTAVFTPTVAGLLPNWVQMADNVTLAAGEQVIIPLTIRVPEAAVAEEQAFAVVVTTPTNGQDQAGAALLVADLLDVTVTPKAAVTQNSSTVTYTLTVTNLETVARTYDLAVTGLDASDVDLTNQITIMAGEVVTLPLAVTAYENHGAHNFAVQATNQSNGVQGDDDALLTVLGDPRVQATLTPDTAVSGPGVPLTYTLTVINAGDLVDTYDLQVNLPAGWTARLDANDTTVTELALTPHVFNAADLLLIVTPPTTAVVGDYDFSVSVQSQLNPSVVAVAEGTATLTAYGVTVQLSPDQTTLAPTDTGVWQVMVTNVGSTADSYDLSAGGIVAGLTTFSQNPVSLAPGESTTVQMTATPMEFALVQTYSVEVNATSLYDSRIWNHDRAAVQFSGYEAVDVGWLPVTQVLTDTPKATYMLLITNTGNLGTSYNLSIVAPGLVVQEIEINQVYIPPHMTAGIPVTLRATAAGTYLITGQVDAITGAATGNSIATLIVEESAVQHPPLAVSDQITTTEDTAVTIPVLANDSDADGDLLTITALTQPLSGTAVINLDNTLTYTPALNTFGIDSFTYTVDDGHNGTATAVVVVTVTPVNDAPVALDDDVTTLEDTTVTINVLGNDSDVEGDSLTVTTITQPGNGSAVLNVDGTITYTPDPDFNSADSASGSDSFSYTVADVYGSISTAVVFVTVTPVNDNPVAVNDTAAANEDTTVILTVLANDSDVDGDILTVIAVSAPVSGTTILNADGTISYTPNANVYGSDSFTYTVSDGYGGEDTATVSISIAPVNDAPVAVMDSAITNEDTAVIIAVLVNDSDADGDTLTVTAVTTPTYGSVVINPDNTITYTPAANDNGSDSFAYTVDDGNGGMATALVDVTITPVNDPPHATDDAILTGEDTAVTLAVLANDSDVDGDTLTVVSITQPGHGTAVINLDNSLTYTPTTNFNGTESFSYTVDDGNGGTDTALVTITVSGENDNPIAVDDNSSTLEDTPVIIPVLTNDSDIDGDTLTVTAVTTPTNGTVAINADNTVTYTPYPNVSGSDSFVYTISDGHGGADTAVVTLTITPVNDAPLAVADTATTNEDLAVIVYVLDNDSDVEGDTLTVTAVSTATHGSVMINVDSSLTYTPTANFFGSDTFTYTVDDGYGGMDTAVVTITVTLVNDVPLAVNDTAATNEDTAVTVNVLDNDSDVDGDTLTVSSVTTATHGVVVINLDQSLTYTPTANYHGADNFSYTITDGYGGVAVAMVTVAVNPVNDTPVAVDDQTATAEDTAVTIPVLANDYDADGDSLVVVDVTQPMHGSAVINLDGSLTYTPTLNYNGEDSLVYTVDDGYSAMATAMVTITVTPVNDAPQAADDAVSTAEDTAVVISVLDNDQDVDGDSVTVTAVTQPGSGVVVINGDNTVTYTPLANTSGTVSFSYTIDDGHGGTDTAVVTVTINTENDNPVAVPDSATTAEDTAVIIAVLDNDSDMDGDPLTVTTVTQPANGTAVVNADNTVTYTPTANYYGSDSFTYTVIDGQGGADTAVVTITITPVNDAPQAVDDEAATNESVAVTIDVLANDSDVDGDMLLVSAITQPLAGTVSINPDNSITYTPDTGFVGMDSFTYTIDDGYDGLDTAVVTITVRPTTCSCSLYPIALHVDSLNGVVPGDVVSDILNGEGPGNFGWLTWNGNNSVPALIASLTPPGNSHIYVNPYNHRDHRLSVGDWVEGKPGVSNAKGVRDALDELKSRVIVVPVWSTAEGSGANAVYYITGFATVRLLDYQLPGQDRITVQFLGYTSCGQGGHK